MSAVPQLTPLPRRAGETQLERSTWVSTHIQERSISRDLKEIKMPWNKWASPLANKCLVKAQSGRFAVVQRAGQPQGLSAEPGAPAAAEKREVTGSADATWLIRARR